ncbi:transcriptional regulator [Marinobacterium nitratireducens]|uniref:HTH-type transcriptional repressor AllR n=2 Tax=Marinobacterium nitratireducens TaxID=518897 RepID=A0A917ZMT8_9GAMM|nr:transcriptional regulator [Marinobacterium nitratireducens]
MNSYSKMLGVLDLFSPECLQLTTDAIAERTGLSRATVYRYVRDLCESGLLSRGDNGYVLGARIIELDWMMRQYDPLLRAGRSLMHELSQETGLAVFASVFFESRIINTHIDDPNDTYQFAFGRGRPLPVFRGAQSKVLIAHQKGRRLRRLFDEQIATDPGNQLDWASFARASKKIRNDGYCITHDEVNPGLTGIAAPIITPDNHNLVGSISAVGASHKFELLRADTVIEKVIDTANRIAANLRRRHRPADGVEKEPEHPQHSRGLALSRSGASV